MTSSYWIYIEISKYKFYLETIFLFHFCGTYSISTSFKITLISLSIIVFQILKGCEVMFLLSVQKRIYQCSLYILFEIIIFSFLHWKLWCPLLSTELFSLYNICLEDISEGIWIVKIGMYFLGFLQSVSPLLFLFQCNVQIMIGAFRKYSIQTQKIFYRFELFYVPLLTFQLFAVMQMSMNLNS